MADLAIGFGRGLLTADAADRLRQTERQLRGDDRAISGADLQDRIDPERSWIVGFFGTELNRWYATVNLGSSSLRAGRVVAPGAPEMAGLLDQAMVPDNLWTS
jgi:hypothetical protein